MQVSIHFARALAVFLHEQGASPGALPQGTKSFRELQWPVTGMIDWARMVDDLGLAHHLDMQPALALDLGNAVSPQPVPALGHLLLQCPTLRVAIIHVQRYMPLLLSPAALFLTERDGRAHLTLTTAPEDSAAVRFVVELTLSWSAGLGRQFLGQRAAPRAVHLPYARPDHASAYEAIFRCPVMFECAEAELVFDAGALDMGQPFHNERLYRVLHDHAERELEVDGIGSSWHSRVVEILEDRALTHSDDATQLLSARLGVSTRALRRHLAKEGYRLSELQDEARKRQALRLLAQTNEPVKSISERVGFSEASAFCRAFRRWTDLSPKRYRFERRGIRLGS